MPPHTHALQALALQAEVAALRGQLAEAQVCEREALELQVGAHGRD